MEKEKMIFWRGEHFKVKMNQYRNGRIAIQLFDEDYLPYTTASVNLPDHPLEKDEVVIKNIDENAGVLDVLVAAGVVSNPIRFVRYGYSSYGLMAPVCKVL